MTVSQERSSFRDPEAQSGPGVRLAYLPRPVVLRYALPSVVAGVLSACSLAPEPLPPVPASVRTLPEVFAAGELEGAYEPLEWWTSFADPVLDEIIQEVLASNFDLAAAVARVEQARMQAGLARAAMFPLVQPSVGGVEFDTPTNAGIGAQLDELGLGTPLESVAGIALPDRLGLTTYSLSMEFAYEADFWGRNRNDALAAGAAHLASESDYVSARMGVLSETIATYLEVVNLRAQEGLAERTVEIAGQLEALAVSRYDSGLTDVRDLYAARRNLRTAEAELLRIEALLADAEGRLWVLVGGYSEELEDLLPDAMAPTAAYPPAPAGIVADLLVQRPDVNAARQRVDAARFSVGARRAELFPRLSLQGFIGIQSTDADEWFDVDQWFRNLSLNLLGPVFQGSRRRSQLALAEAQLNEATAAYGRSVIAAVTDVETALTGLESNRRRHALLTSVMEDAEAEADLLEQRYISGVAAYEEFLSAAQSLVAAEGLLAAAERDLGYARLALHRALGGAWTAEDAEAIQE
ncbi:MAG: TolC family protein [Gammaproteobacteria bacterium]|nr:TolC family protein [Gammaproteobacteria bacterium]MDE0246839.1 TolC family protein [Gammaproteobacteria bacterium]